jgi:hypothetical protein
MTIKQTIRAVLPIFLSCFWLCSGAFAHASSPATATATSTATATATATIEDAKTPSYHVRRRLAETVEAIQQKRRDLNDFVPAFSRDDESLVYAQMPNLTLLLRGLDGGILGEKSYDALQTAMNDYLNKRFEDYFVPRYEFKSVRSRVVNDNPFAGGNYVTMETSLAFQDPDYVPPGEEDFRLPRQRAYASPTFRVSDVFEIAEAETKSASTAESGAVPSELELEFAAGYAWNDLTSFRNHLLVAATIENLETFQGIENIDSLEDFPAGVDQEAEDTTLVEDEEEEQQNEEDPSEVEPEVTAPSGSSLNVAAASSSLRESGTDRMNPLWPSLIVGLAVFLFTIIILGYRKHKARGNDQFFFGRGRSNGSFKKPDNVLIHVNLNDDNSTMQGDEEIEVEDQLYSTSTPNSTPDRRELQKKKERDLDKEYATSCLKPAALVLSSSTPPSSSAVSDDDEEDENNNNSYDGDGEGRKSCLKKIGRRRSKSKRVSLQDQDSMAIESNNSRGINLPRRVDLTATPDQSSWRNPANLRQEEGVYDNGDLTKKERKRFAKYMESGMSVEEASSQVLRERKPITWAPVAPSETTRTRSGEIGGYSNPRTKNGHRGSPGRVQKGAQSNPMDCCAEDAHQSEVMEDGTAIHYVQEPSYMSLGAACSANDPSLLNGIRDESKEGRRGNGNGNRRIDGTARAMVITAASSYASSYDYDDEEFDRAMEEAAAETAMA